MSIEMTDDIDPAPLRPLEARPSREQCSYWGCPSHDTIEVEPGTFACASFHAQYHGYDTPRKVRHYTMQGA